MLASLHEVVRAVTRQQKESADCGANRGVDQMRKGVLVIPPALARRLGEVANVRLRFGPHRWKMCWSPGHALAVLL